MLFFFLFSASVRFRPAISTLPDSISFVASVSRTCYADGHAGNEHPSVTNERTNFSWTNADGIQEACTKWYFHERSEGVLDQVGAIVYRQAARQLVIGFRGSVYDTDWARNLQATLLAEDADVRMHSGFRRRYESIIPFSGNIGEMRNNALLWNIRQVVDSERIDLAQVQIIFTGHSAGAALATLAAFSLKKNEARELPYSFNNFSINQVCLITFSSPRVGDNNFATTLENKLGIVNVLRFTCSSDTVPHVPPEGFGYKHAGIEIPITTVERAFDDDESPTRSTLDYVRSTRLFKFIGYPIKVVQSGISSVLLPLTGLSALVMHSMPSDLLVVGALGYAQSRYNSNDCDLREIGYVYRLSSSRRFAYFL